jgi:hypothetical protein
LELVAEPMRDVARWIGRYEQFWTERLDRLEAFFAAKATTARRKDKSS